jgi:hypothetical protein
MNVYSPNMVIIGFDPSPHDLEKILKNHGKVTQEVAEDWSNDPLIPLPSQRPSPRPRIGLPGIFVF